MTEFQEIKRMSSGVLYIVPTPIGNLEDITLRALRVLREADRLLAEDTRHSGVLCRHYGITAPLVSFTDHNAPRRLPQVLGWLAAGERVALVSDAGTPGISDPGLPLVREALAAGVRVEALPGATALIPALAASGLAADRFLFAGFPPRKSAARRRWLATLERAGCTVILYESPKRLAGLLADVAAVTGEARPVVVARELTKIHETYHRGGAGELAARFQAEPPRGEVVVLVAGGSAPGTEPPPSDAGLEQRLLAALAEGLGVKGAAERVAAETGLPRRRLYHQALALQQGDDPAA